MNNPSHKVLSPYEKKLMWRKVRMYLVWVVSFIVCFFFSCYFYNVRYMKTLDPQISQAYSQIANLLPAIQSNEDSVMQTYSQMLVSRTEAAASGITLSQNYSADSQSVSEVLKGCFAIDRITQLKVGHNGSVVVVDRQSGEILAHPNGDQVGKTMFMVPLSASISKGIPWGSSLALYEADPDIDLDSFKDANAARRLRLGYQLLFPGTGTRGRLLQSIDSMILGTVVPYGENYIICGTSILEYIAYMSQALYISLIATVMLWLFVHFISLTLDRHEQSGKALRTQLTAYGLLLTIAIFGISWYVQVLNGVTNELNTIHSYADSAVANLETYENTQKRINSWLDDQYLIQCRVARDYVKSKGIDQITRKDLAQMSQKLGVEHIYVFDPDGKVIVTNSPYDHFRLSRDENDPSYAFLGLLEGADHVVRPPMPDEVTGARTQFIGVSLRNDEDKADGFVQISIDPALRDYLTKPLGVSSVLANTIVGLPEHALAFDRDNLTVSATTGLGFVGQSIEDFGYSVDKLKNTNSGFLKYGGKSYYAGFSESENYWFVPVSERTSDNESLYTALRIAVIELICIALIIFVALFHYQRDVVDAAPPAAREDTEASAPKELSLTEQTLQFSGITSIVHIQQKRGFDKRWHRDVPVADQTPGMRVKAIAYRLLLIFCAISLLPLVYGSLSNGTGIAGLNSLAYVLYGGWEKGANIFALTSCLFLLFALYVFVSLAGRILYAIARVSNLRVETICLLLNSSLKYVCVIAFIYYGLSRFGIPTQALLASAGIITLAVSMSAKDLVSDIVAGFFILVEGHLKVGDFITVGSWSGVVQEIGLRTTKVALGNDTKIYNNSSLRDIINSDQEVVRQTMSLAIASDASLTEIEAILYEELPGLMNGVPGLVRPAFYDGADTLEDGRLALKICIEVKSNTQTSALRQLSRRLKLMFERRGIEFPDNPTFVYQPDNVWGKVPEDALDSVSDSES